jgi:hypothetical protein
VGVRNLAAGALLALLVCCSTAAAQGLNIQLPLPDGAVGDALPGDAVEQIVTQDLPEPLGNVVEATPVAPVVDEVERVVSQDTGGGGSGGGGGGGGSGGGANPAAVQPVTNDSTPGTGGGSGDGSAQTGGSGGSGGSGDGDGRGTRRDGAPAGGGADDGTPAGGGGAADGGAAGAGAGPGGTAEPGTGREERSGTAEGGADGNVVTRTIDNVVQVVPPLLWVALGLLSAVALALGGRAIVEERRGKRLTREREQLLRDVGLLERALLPKVPEELGGLAASVAYRACEGPAAGGDFYDAFELSDGRAAVLVGDVSGHGPEALERTNSLRVGLHACLEGGMAPRRALETVGRSSAHIFDGNFATVVLAVHDPAAGTLTYATAGHPPPIVDGPSAHEPVTAASAPPIGLGFRTGLRQTTVALAPDSVVCLFTDGILEARYGAELLGRERLTELVAKLGPDEGAEELLARVIDEADESPDDMAVCVLRAGAGAPGGSTRVEELELDAEEASNGVATRFLEACELDPEATPALLEELRTTAASSGAAVLAVTIDESGPLRATVTPAGSVSATAAVS